MKNINQFIKNKLSIILGISLLLFVSILIFMYLQSITAFENLLKGRIDEVASSFCDDITDNFPILEQESIVISRGRVLKDLYSIRPESISEEKLYDVKNFVDWFIKNSDLKYSLIGYVSDNGKILYDSDRKTENILAPTYSEKLEIAQSFSKDTKDLGLKIKTLTNGEVLIFFNRAIRMRDIKGSVFGAIPLSQLAEVELNEHTDLFIANRDTKNLLYSSNSDYSRDSLKKKSIQANYMFVERDIDNPRWTISVTINTAPYLEEPKKAGIITLVVSIFFVFICSGIIMSLLNSTKKHNEQMEAELKTAHDMQMNLMPDKSPNLNQLNISGLCRPATEVGGDFFQYYPKDDGRFAFVIADVTGHGMKAAIPTVLFSGILDNQMEIGVETDKLFDKLNKSLCRKLKDRTFVCCAFGEIDTENMSLRFTNGGCPYPYHYKNSTQTTEEIILDALPLGVRDRTEYSFLDCKLEQGDKMVFCSDGIIESQNEKEEVLGFDKTRHIVNRLATSNVSAPDIVSGIMQEVDIFRGSAEQDDDQTVVVIEVL